MMSDALIWADVCRAEHVINSETEDIAKRVKEITGVRNCLQFKGCIMLLPNTFPYLISCLSTIVRL